MSKTRTLRTYARGAAFVIVVTAAGLACTPGSSSQCGSNPLGGPTAPGSGPVGIVYACNLPPPTAVSISGPCAQGDGVGIQGVGAGTCVVDIDFPNGLKFSASIPYTALQFECNTYYVSPFNEIVVGDVPRCDETDGEPPPCRCLIDVACDSGALCIDAGEWDGAVYTP